MTEIIAKTQAELDAALARFAWTCERTDRHPGFLGIEGQHEHEDWLRLGTAVEVLDA